jgi:hypothetical protein
MKTFLKKPFVILVILLACVGIATWALAKPKLHIIITTKYKGQNCLNEGGWCVSISTWGDRVISLPGTTGTTDGRPAELQVADDGRTATLIFSDSNSPARFSTFESETDYAVSPEIARLLGCSSVTLLKGIYKVDYTKYRNGCIVFNTRVQ